MPEKLPYFHLDKGMFLIATPEVNEGIYFRSVALLCEHHEGGSFGLIVNKPLDMQLPEEVLDLENSPNKNVQTRTGGPNQTGQMVLLHSTTNAETKALKVCDNVYLGGDLAFLQTALQQTDGPYIYLCFGFRNWGPGELEKEYLAGKWFLYPATSDHLFKTPPEKLWQTLLREMGGKYASLSMIPEDLSLN